MIIERTNEEYLQDLEEEYRVRVKPLLDEGMSLTATFNKLGITSGKYARKYWELRRIALEDGYQLRR